MAQAEKKRTRKKEKADPVGIAYIRATFNNTLITITDTYGNTLSWATCGHMGFKGSRKSTPYAAGQAASNAAKTAIDLGVQKVSVNVNGPGPGRESAIRSLSAAGLEVMSIKDTTPLPHNGCRPKKRRRI